MSGCCQHGSKFSGTKIIWRISSPAERLPSSQERLLHKVVLYGLNTLQYRPKQERDECSLYSHMCGKHRRFYSANLNFKMRTSKWGE
jgi:hypothetical protein